jgi:pimeloyl-ACP methyl ester carboxylesterase/DNA-binding CsgD family transcriptional regulator
MDAESQFIELVYGATQNPDHLPDVIGGVARLVLSGGAQTRLLDHVRRASGLIRTEQGAGQGRPSGRVIAALNADLEPVVANSPENASETPLPEDALALARRALETRRTQVRMITLRMITPRMITPGEHDHTPVMLLAIPAGPDSPQQAEAVTLVALERNETHSHAADLVAVFGLTEAEARVAASIADGKTLAQTARSLNLSRETAKTHLERIFDKTGTRKQTLLAQLLIQTTILSETLGALKRAPSLPGAMPVQNDKAGATVWTHHSGPFAGHRVGAHVFGPETGKPTLLFHSTFMGAGVWPAMVQAAHARNRRIAMMLRPGFAPSSALAPENSLKEFDDRIAADIGLAFASLGWEAADLVGFGGGAAFAYRFASTHPGHVLGLRIYSPSPIFSATAQTGEASGLAGAINVAALASPEMVAAVSELFASSISDSVLKALVETYYAPGTRDNTLLEKPGLMAFLKAQTAFALTDASKGVISDHALLAAIKTLPTAGPDLDALIVLGEDDAVNRLTPKDPWLNLEDARCVRLAKAGHLDFFTDLGRILDALEL